MKFSNRLYTKALINTEQAILFWFRSISSSSLKILIKLLIEIMVILLNKITMLMHLYFLIPTYQLLCYNETIN